jgi:hypothetical protein
MSPISSTPALPMKSSPFCECELTEPITQEVQHESHNLDYSILPAEIYRLFGNQWWENKIFGDGLDFARHCDVIHPTTTA